MTWEMLEGFVRHLLTMIGGILVAKGWVDDATAASLVGAALTIAGFLWSMLNKKKVESKVEAALMMPPPKK